MPVPLTSQGFDFDDSKMALRVIKNQIQLDTEKTDYFGNKETTLNFDIFLIQDLHRSGREVSGRCKNSLTPAKVSR